MNAADPMRHSPACSRPDVALERGYSITVHRCPEQPSTKG